MKKIALINDLSSFGKCSLTAAIPVVSAMGIQAVPLPTAILSAQTGFESYYCDDFADRMGYFTDEWKKMGESFDGIHSGYLTGPSQIKETLRFLDAFHTDGTVYLADPVMGDNGRSFPFSDCALQDGMKQLCARADAVTPNLTELCLLAKADYDALVCQSGNSDYIARIEDIARELLNQMKSTASVFVTGIKRSSDNGVYMGNLVVSQDKSFYLETPCVPQSFSGTGDLFASAICGFLVKGLSPQDALKRAMRFLSPAISEAAALGAPRRHGVCFENYLKLLMD